MKKLRTSEEHVEFLKEIIKLKLYFVAVWKNKNPELSVPILIKDHTMLINFTDFNSKAIFNFPECNDEEKWANLVDRMEKSYVKDINPELFVEKTFPLLEKYISKRVEDDMWAFNYFAYNEERRKLNIFLYDLDSSDEYLEFHIENMFYPESFLRFPDLFKKNMVEMVSDAEKAGFKGLKTNSWLNNLAGWLKYFPPVWQENLLPVVNPTGNNLGIWGQFFTSALFVNKDRFEKFAETKALPYPTKICYADIADFKKFLGMDS